MVYINDIHILMYAFVGLIGGITGFFAGWCNERLPEYKKILTKDIFLEYRSKLKPNYILIILNAAINVFILYRVGIHHSAFLQNIQLIEYLVLVPMLLSVFCIDYKLKKGRIKIIIGK